MKSTLRRLLYIWQKVLEPIGIAQSKIIFLIIYIVLFWPVGFISSLFTDLVKIKEKKAVWHLRTQQYKTIKEAKQQ